MIMAVAEVLYHDGCPCTFDRYVNEVSDSKLWCNNELRRHVRSAEPNVNGLLLCPADSLLRLLVQRDCPTEMSLHNTEDIDTYMHKIIVTGLEFYT